MNKKKTYKKNYSVTNHAYRRMKQRGFNESAIPLFLNYGHFVYVRDGAKSYSISKTEKLSIKSDLGINFKSIEKSLDKYLIFTGKNRLLTVANPTKRLKRH